MSPVTTSVDRREISISGRVVGEDRRPYVIAEIGVNHDGEASRAIRLVEAAANAGADAAKFQLFESERLMSRASRLAKYQAAAGERDPVEMLRRLELSIDELAPCVERAHKAGIHAIVSVFSVELMAVAEQLPWDAYKSASPDIINRPLLEAMATTGKPLIISTGAASIDEVERAIGWLEPWRENLAILQCVSSYPTPREAAQLRGITALRATYDGPVGYSDHTQETETAADAVALGACILEKHFTHNRAQPGPDHAASLEPASLAEYVRLARDAFDRRGRLDPAPPSAAAHKRITPIEEDVRRVSRQSLVAKRDLAAGHALAAADLTIKRPGTGIPPFELASTLGRRLARAVAADTPLEPADLQP